MDERILPIYFPVGGIDRSVGYQFQQPYTTVKAQNVWPSEVATGRARGGSRPGLGPFIRERLSTGPVRMLAKVGILTEPDNTTAQGIVATQFRMPGAFTYPDYAAAATTWIQPTWADCGMVAEENGAVAATPGLLGAAINITSDSRYLGDKYEFGFKIKPRNGLVTGTYKLYFDADNSFINARELSITLDGSGGYSGNLDGTPFSGTGSDPGGGWLTMRVSGSGGSWTATAYWRSVNLGSVGSLSLANKNWGFGIQWTGTQGGGSIDELFTEFPTTSRKEYRKEVLCAISNKKLFYETSPRTMTEFTGSTHEFSNSRRIEAAEYLQKLYIADYGTLWKGTDGILTGATTFTNAAATNFQTQGVTDDYVLYLINSNAAQNEIQQIALTGTTGGTFQITFDGQTTGNIAYNASAATIELALEALANINDGDIAVGGAFPTWTVVFIGQYAGTDMPMLYVDTTALTGPGPPAVTVTETQAAFSGQTIIKSYPISSVVGTTITLGSGPSYPGALSPLTSLEYVICRPTRVFDPKALTLTELTATTGKGTAPIGARLVSRYLDRMVFASLPDAPHLWFMSRQGDPLDYDYGQLDAGAAVSSQSTEMGEIGDPITAIIPHSDQCLIFGCYSSLWILRGDPAAGGRIDPISKDIGVVDARAWCHLPTGEIVFMSQDGLYIFPAGCHGTPAPLSRDRMPLEFIGLTSQYTVQLEYDVDFRGIHIYLTREDKSRVYHWWFDWSSKSFWPMQLQTDHEPTATCSYTPINTGRFVLLGGRDGYVRHFSRDYYTDDGGVRIDSFVDMGPLKVAEDYSEGLVTQLQCTLGRGSGSVDWSLRTGQTAEDAAFGDRIHSSGTFGERLNYTARPRTRGAAVVLRLAGKEFRPWFYETGLAVISSGGRKRRRW